MNDSRLQELYNRALAERAGDGRDSCVTPEALRALIERDGSEDDRLATLDHVMSCDACRREFELLRSVEMAGMTLEKERAAVPIQTGVKRPIPAMAIAASLAIVIIGGIVGTRLIRTREPDVLRGGGVGVVLVAPIGDVTVTDSIAMVWHHVAGAVGYDVELLDPDGSPLASGATTDTTWTIRSDLVQPGVEYRWWVRTRSGNGSERRSAIRSFRVRDQE